MRGALSPGIHVISSTHAALLREPLLKLFVYAQRRVVGPAVKSKVSTRQFASPLICTAGCPFTEKSALLELSADTFHQNDNDPGPVTVVSIQDCSRVPNGPLLAASMPS